MAPQNNRVTAEFREVPAGLLDDHPIAGEVARGKDGGNCQRIGINVADVSSRLEPVWHLARIRTAPYNSYRAPLA